MSVRPYIEILSGPTAGQAAEKIAEILHAAKETNGQAEWFPLTGEHRLYIVPTVDNTVIGYQIHSLTDASIDALYQLFTTLSEQTDWRIQLDWDELEYLDPDFPYQSLTTP